MTLTLNEDIFTLIYSHTFDFEVLRSAAIATATNKRHPLRSVVLRRLLQLPLRLSSGNLKDSKTLIDHFVRNPAHAYLVRDIAIVLGPSRTTLADHQRFYGNIRHEDLEEAEKAEALVELLPELLRRTENLRRLDWSKHPLPNKETLKGLSELSIIIHLSLDCSATSDLPDPPEQSEPDTRNK
jgi:hypothetical protein